MHNLAAMGRSGRAVACSVGPRSAMVSFATAAPCLLRRDACSPGLSHVRSIARCRQQHGRLSSNGPLLMHCSFARASGSVLRVVPCAEMSCAQRPAVAICDPCQAEQYVEPSSIAVLWREGG